MTGYDWHDGRMSEEDLSDLAAQAKAARLAKKWSKERAAREADVSSITYKRVEDGLPVQDAKRAAVVAALGIDFLFGDGGVELVGPSSVSGDSQSEPEFEFLTRVREDLTAEEMDQLMTEATPYLEMLVRDIKNRNRDR